MFGKAGRNWLRTLELPAEECETVEAAMRHIEFLDSEIAEVERLIAREMLWSSDTRTLMSVPGVNLICAAAFLAAIGDVRRFPGSQQRVACLGLDPNVRQSGSEPARTGRISKQGSPQARWALVEATTVLCVSRPLRVSPAHPCSPGLQHRDRRRCSQAGCLFWYCSPAGSARPTPSRR